MTNVKVFAMQDGWPDDHDALHRSILMILVWIKKPLSALYADASKTGAVN